MMATLLSDLRAQFRRGDICLRYIYVNVGVFVFTSLLGVLLLLFNRSAAGVLQWFELPASLWRLLHQPWSLFTYMFVHAGLLHVLFNMLWLYWFGGLFLQFFSARHFRGLYWLGGLGGGLLYMVAYHVFPYFQPALSTSMLVGASASVLAVGVATAFRAPDYRIHLMFVGPVRLKYMAFFLVLTDLLLVTGGNGGGHIAHLGGALAGWWFASSLSKGRDVTRWINGTMDAFASLFSGDLFRRRRSKPKMRVHFGDRMSDYEYNARKKAQADEIDRILDKLRKSGYDSLSSDEKKRLFEAGKK